MKLLKKVFWPKSSIKEQLHFQLESLLPSSPKRKKMLVNSAILHFLLHQGLRLNLLPKLQNHNKPKPKLLPQARNLRLHQAEKEFSPVHLQKQWLNRRELTWQKSKDLVQMAEFWNKTLIVSNPAQYNNNQWFKLQRL